MPIDNKSVLKTALTELFVERDASALSRYWQEPYPQHNPGMPDGASHLAQSGSNASFEFETKRMLGEGDFVVTHSVLRGWGPEPMVVFDIFLLRGGKIVEHWDVMQPVAEKTVSGRSQTDGPTEVAGPERTTASKAVVQGLLDDVFYGQRMEKLTTYINPSQYHQHNPGVGDGLEGFGAAMAELAKAGLKMEYKKTYRIIADGNFVFVHSEGEFAGRHVAFADLFRVEDGKIVEHWDCIQDVVPPEKAANKNGMFRQVTP